MAEIAEARAYLLETASPAYTMTLQGPEVAIAAYIREFAVRLESAIRQARNVGLPFAGIFSAYRPPVFGVGGFSDKFNSLHTYGLAVDMRGIGRPGSPKRNCGTRSPATGIARSVRAPPRRNGSPRGRPTCFRLRTSMWCSRCRRPLRPSPIRTRPRSTTSCFQPCRPDRHRGRSQAPGRSHRHHRGASHLGIGDDAPSACAHDRAGRRHLSRRITMGLVQIELFPARAGSLAPVPGIVPGQAPRRPPGRPPQFFWQPRPPR